MTTKITDPIELDDDIEIDTPPIEESFEGTDETIGDEDDEEEGGFFDDDKEEAVDEDDEDQPVVKKPKVKKAPKEKKVDGTIIRKYPQVGAMYSTKLILIEVTDKFKKTYTCKVLASQEPSRWKVGDCFEAEEIAFYSDYYQFAGFVKK